VRLATGAQSVWACDALSGAMPWSTQLPAHSMRPRCLHTHRGSSNGSITYVTHSIPSSRRRRMASPREETNLTSYTDQLARPFEHEEALLFGSARPLRASTASSPTIAARAVQLPRLVSAQPLDDEAAA